jgi:hypothetical protein
MFSIEYDDIDLQWHNTPPLNRDAAERVIRANLREHVLPTKPYDLMGYFIVLAAVGSVVHIYGKPGSEAYHCLYFQ